MAIDWVQIRRCRHNGAVLKLLKGIRQLSLEERIERVSRCFLRQNAQRVGQAMAWP